LLLAAATVLVDILRPCPIWRLGGMKSTGTKSAFAGKAGPKSQPSVDLQEQICRREQELYKQRGREEGHALDDWLQAEAELVKRKARTAGASS
jgi:hypothetical protein